MSRFPSNELGILRNTMKNAAVMKPGMANFFVNQGCLLKSTYIEKKSIVN